ncbi:MAG: glycosyltransferase family 4 protein [Actinobacteria bacterium]|nr:MAG: glycosyltransferase family 4 protein [Actinomycetota bacterium]
MPTGVPLAIYAGRLVPVKRVDRLIGIWPAVRRAFPSAHLAIAGEGPLEGELKSKAGEGVQFLGGLADVRPLMQSADLLVLPSDAEGLPVSLVEAMACGLPCLATRVGGVPEAVADGETGLLIPPGDADRLREALLRLLADPALRESMGRQARLRVQEKYSLEQMALRTRALYLNVLRGGGIHP